MFDTYTTIALVSYIKNNPEAANLGGAWVELESRIIEENDADDTTQHRGGIRPENAPRV